MAQDRFRGRGIQKQPSDKHRINEQISARTVRLIGAEGEQLGIVVREDALKRADDVGLDLVEVAGNTDPPVCKILDYGKLKYREQKKAAEAKKKSAVQVVKELRIRPATDEHDLDTKIRAARKFLENGDRVRFQMRFKGREVDYKQLGIEMMNKVVELLNDVGVVEELSPLIGTRMILSLVPKGQAK